MAQFCRRNASVYFKGFLDKVHTVIISNVGILHIRSSITIHQNDQSSQNVAIVPKMHVSAFYCRSLRQASSRCETVWRKLLAHSGGKFDA